MASQQTPCLTLWLLGIELRSSCLWQVRYWLSCLPSQVNSLCASVFKCFVCMCKSGNGDFLLCTFPLPHMLSFCPCLSYWSEVVWHRAVGLHFPNELMTLNIILSASVFLYPLLEKKSLLKSFVHHLIGLSYCWVIMIFYIMYIIHKKKTFIRYKLI